MNHLDEADAALRRYAAVAVDRYVKACEQDTSDRALAGLVRALWQARLWDHARKQLARLDGHGSVHAELARGMVALGQPDRIWWLGVDSGSAVRDDVAAEAAFSAAIALDPANAEARAGHATALRMAGRLREAREELKSLDDALLATAVVQLELAICAFEDDDLALADEHSRRAMEHEPGSVRAELVLLEIARHTDRGSADVVTQAKSLAARNPVRVVGELYGWVLFDRAKNSADQKQALTEALTVFTKAAPPQGVWPGVVGGRAAVLLAAGRVEEAREDIERAVAVESCSPLLHRYRAEATIAVDRTTKGRLEAFQRVLEFDPRDLRSRLEVVDALVELGRADEAMQMVTALRTELPGSSRVAKAWTFLATPWRMPEPGDVRQRIARPWENGHDERAEIIGILIDEVVEKLTLQPAVADRIRHQVSVDNAVYRPAVDEEHAYLDARDDYHRTVRQKHRHRIARSYSYALFSLSALVCGAGIATLIQQGLALVTIAWWPPVTWVIVASLAVFLFLWIMGRVDDKTFQRGAVAAAAFSTAGWAWGLLRFEDIRVGAPFPSLLQRSPSVCSGVAPGSGETTPRRVTSRRNERSMCGWKVCTATDCCPSPPKQAA
ncbi:hypothetical protein GCM10029964_090690 [Kibdelosporangium lantanae]